MPAKSSDGVISVWVKGLITIGFIIIIWYLGNATIFAPEHGIAPAVENIEADTSMTPFSGVDRGYWFWGFWPLVAVGGVLIYMFIGTVRRRTTSEGIT